MKKWRWEIIIAGSIVLGVTAIILTKELNRKRRGKSKFRRDAVKVAIDEWQKWNMGEAKENSSKMYSRLRDYWRSVGWGDNAWTPSGVAWSSAFISYVMKKANAGGDFKYSSSHSSYIRAAVKNRKQNNKNPFKAYRLNERKAEVGDLVCYARQSGIGYDTITGYKSHCDIIVGIDKGVAEVIGGNVSNSVTKKDIPLTTKGYVSGGGSRFTIIKTK